MRVLITGAGKRIGSVIARAFAQHGHQILIHYCNSRHEAEALCRELGGPEAGHSTLQADLANPDDLAALFPRLADTDRLPDCLINNAATFPRRPLIDHDLAFIEETMRVNCHAPFLLMRDFARLVRRGVIINILDQRIHSVSADVGAYAIAKKALRDFTLACARDWAPAIRVNAVAPGLTLKPPDMPQELRDREIAQVPMGRESPCEEIAAACHFLAQAATTTGAILPIDGGLHLT